MNNKQKSNVHLERKHSALQQARLIPEALLNRKYNTCKNALLKDV